MGSAINLPGVISEVDRYLRSPTLLGPQSGVEDSPHGQGILLPNIFFVDPSAGQDGNSGLDPRRALKTLQTAIDLCVANRGDIIVVQRGNLDVTETITFNKAGITVIGQQFGISPFAHGEEISVLANASFTDGPVATITATCAIHNMAFVSRDTGATFFDGAAMLIGGLATALPFGVHIRGCRFPKWNVSNRIGIAIEGSSDVLIEDCDFEGVGADFDSGIYVQGACQNLSIRRNHFKDCTFGVEFGAFAGGGPHVMLGPDNVFEDGKVLSASNAATGLVFGNYSEGATDGGSYNSTVNTLNALGLVFSDMHYAE